MFLRNVLQCIVVCVVMCCGLVGSGGLWYILSCVALRCGWFSDRVLGQCDML